MENSLKGLILAAGTIITCVVISLGFYIAREAKATSSTGTNQINRVNTEFAESDKVMYDGSNISGSEVISVIHKMQGQGTGVCVKTAAAENYYGYEFDTTSGELKGENSAKYATNTSASNAAYINPYAIFQGQVIRNENDVITGIVFTQS